MYQYVYSLYLFIRLLMKEFAGIIKACISLMPATYTILSSILLSRITPYA